MIRYIHTNYWSHGFMIDLLIIQNLVQGASVSIYLLPNH